MKFNVIAAAAEDFGIGLKGDLPWRLKKEMAFFTKMTTGDHPKNKMNAVLMGRRTWEVLPDKYKPLPNRLNVVVSSTLSEAKDALVYPSLEEAVMKLTQPPLRDTVNELWVIGGSVLYKSALDSPSCNKLYLTRIHKRFDCDTFFPPIPDRFVQTEDPDIPQGVQEEKGIQYEYTVYEPQTV